MRLGFHISIAGGLSQVVPRALKLKCETIQFFSRNPRAWRDSLIHCEEIQKFKEALAQTDIFPVFVHTPYLLNLASQDQDLYARSISYLGDELEQAERMGASFVIVHTGNKLGSEEKEALQRVAQAINKAFAKTNNFVQLLLENTAGQGTEIGYKISHFQEIITQVKDRDRIGICLDTAHAFTAGYDLATAQGLNHMLEEFDALLGLAKLKALHLNDSKAPFGSKKDRHWHIGKGEIGRSGFSKIINHSKLAHLPGIMETPRRSDADDRRNMKVMRSLIH
jgi:deoxyribonuclease IV